MKLIPISMEENKKTLLHMFPFKRNYSETNAIGLQQNELAGNKEYMHMSCNLNSFVATVCCIRHAACVCVSVCANVFSSAQI